MINEITKYIPHRGHMILIDEIIDDSKDNFIVNVRIKPESLLNSELGVPSYTGIEYMAQSVAAFNTLYFSAGESKIGFIVSVRNFKADIDYFQNDNLLTILIDPILVTANSGSFNCSIEVLSEVVCRARITAYVPTNEEIENFKRENYVTE